jgi:TetR/AcrR family transcriptional regulator, cholesterol catabolism regulator
MMAKDTGRIDAAIKNRALLEAKRALIVDTSTKMFIDRGYANVSVNEVAKEANLSIGSLYKYIRTKEDILWLVMDRIYGRLEEELRAERAYANGPVESLMQAFATYMRANDGVRQGILLMYREYPHLSREAQREFMDREKRVVDVFESIIEDGVQSGAFRCTEPRLAALDILAVGAMWALKGWMLRDVSLDDYIAHQSRLILHLVGTVE